MIQVDSIADLSDGCAGGRARRAVGALVSIHSSCTRVTRDLTLLLSWIHVVPETIAQLINARRRQPGRRWAWVTRSPCCLHQGSRSISAPASPTRCWRWPIGSWPVWCRKSLRPLMVRATAPQHAFTGRRVEPAFVWILMPLSPASADHRPRVLAVDDEPTNLQVLRQVLGADYRLLFATDGTRALQIARHAWQYSRGRLVAI